MSLRVREILDALKGTGRKPLLKYIPKATLPEDTKGLFPNAIISQLPHDQKYSLTGLVTEALVLSSEPITADSILEEFTKLGIIWSKEHIDKIKKSKTTTDYINKILKTRELIAEKLLGPPPHTILQGEELHYDCVEGHPDGIAGRTVMEVKTTAKLEDDINYYMLQLSAYTALGDGYYSQALLILPLQQTVLAFDMRMWPKRQYFRNILNQKAKQIMAATPVISYETLLAASVLISTYNIGSHVKKHPTLLETVQSLPSATPYQIFMGGNQNTRLTVKQADLEAAAEFVVENNILVYIHSPYLINLSATPTADEWQLRYMEKLLQYGAQLGAKGVVVHTGKHTTDKYEDGVEKMRKAIETILPFGSPSCPLLLETPSGQGTETLLDPTEFLDFVEGFKSPNIRVCVDTCHVFANGHEPLEYIKAAKARGLLHLVHFNDSQDCCGSCKDRHAPVGRGKIGIEKMTAVAEFCNLNDIDMLVE
jgi:deoxyribonuclease-4